MITLEELYRVLQEVEDTLAENDIFPTLTERERLFAGRVAMVAKRVANKIEWNE